MIELTVALYPDEPDNMMWNYKQHQYVIDVLKDEGFKHSGKFTNKKGVCVHIYRTKDLPKMKNTQTKLSRFQELFR